MEISGSLDEAGRPGFAKMMAAVRDPARPWDVLLALEPSRVARNFFLSMMVNKECQEQGVEFRYSKSAIDETTAAGELHGIIDRGVAQYLSRSSSEKGRAGMETNVSKGFRAGGRPPFGYKLRQVETGATRSGLPVRKSYLVCDSRNAKRVQLFLRKRAGGTARHVPRRKRGSATSHKAR
jgi:DNA invertase Pin-like site-specific DNA recombinase